MATLGLIGAVGAAAAVSGPDPVATLVGALRTGTLLLRADAPADRAQGTAECRVRRSHGSHEA